MKVQEQRLVSDPRQVFQGVVRKAAWSTASTALILVAGCGNNYRPVVSAISPVGPASQPQVYAVALSDPGVSSSGTQLPGLITVVDVFGDTNIANANVAPSPTYLGVDSVGESYVLHNNNVLVDTFTAAAGLQTNQVRQSSLSIGANPTQVFPGSGSNPIYITEPGLNKVAVLTGGSPPTARQELPVPANPVYTVGVAASPRVYTLSQGATPGTSIGTATAIESGTNNTISASIPVGISPIYGVMTSDARRAFIINTGGTGTGTGTVTVLNVQGNNLDATFNVGPNPVWADIAPAINELAVLNQGTSSTNGSLSVINIALCNSTTLPSNTQCNPTNPTDSVNFGQTLATIPVGKNPVQVAVLSDHSKAYVINAGDPGKSNGTISVVDLIRMVKVADIPVGGTLNWVGAVSGQPTGKVLVTASDNQSLTIIRTDNDTVTATIPLQGKGIAVRIAQ